MFAKVFKKMPLQGNSEKNICKDSLYSLLNDSNLIEDYNKYFATFNFQLKRIIEKGYKYLSYNEDTAYTYFRVEQVFSLLCYLLNKEKIIEKYNDLIREFKNCNTIDTRISTFKNFLKKIELEEFSENNLNNCYLEYI